MNLRVSQKVRTFLFDQLSYCLLPKDCCSMRLLNMISSTEWHMSCLEEFLSYYFFKFYLYSFPHRHFNVGQDIALYNFQPEYLTILGKTRIFLKLDQCNIYNRDTSIYYLHLSNLY